MKYYVSDGQHPLQRHVQEPIMYS